VVGTEPSPQLSVTVLVSNPLGLLIIPLTVSVPPSTMLGDDNTRPGGAKTGAGLLMATVVCAKVVLPWGSPRVTPIV